MPPRERPVSPQIAIRVAYLGALAVVVLGIIFFRLWYLQVLDSDQNLAQAQSNRSRDEIVPAPRGSILDRDDAVLVDNRRTTIVVLNPSSLTYDYRQAISDWGVAEARRLDVPARGRPPQAPLPTAPAATLALYRRLAETLDMRVRTIARRVAESMILVPYGDVRIKVDVDSSVRNHIREQQDRFPGVSVEQRFVRDYPHRSLAAQLVGSVGQIGEAELEDPKFRDLGRNAIVGHEGLEYTYDKYLRGVDGRSRIEVTAFGDRRGVRVASEPRVGYSLKTSISLGLQRAGERALRTVGGGKPGAFVAMDPRNGEVYAMGSYPTYDPRILTRPISQATYERIFNRRRAGAPRFNRAISGLYPTASTFKLVTALAGLDTQRISTGTIVDDAGCIQLGEGRENRRCNAEQVPHGQVNVSTALKVSSNVFFYDLSQKLNPLPGQPLQRWAHALGYGSRTGIDLPSEGQGLVPDAAWRDDANRREAACRRREGRPCGIADGTNRGWQGGDEANLATGQGDLQATPLQVALSYATVANGGTVVRPHVGLEVLNERGELIQPITSGRTRRVAIDPEHRNAIMGGLLAATSETQGTTYDVFSDWPHGEIPIYGKTGTAVRTTRPGDQSWFVCYAYLGADRQRPIVIATTIEDAGSGAGAAAPATKAMLAEWFGVEGVEVYRRGESNDR